MIKRIIYITLAIIITLFSVSCSGNRVASKTAAGENIIKIPCSSLKSDKKHIRASFSASSSDLGMSKSKALLLTKKRMAAIIDGQIKAVIEMYLAERTISQLQEYDDSYKGRIIESFSIKLPYINILCEETRMKKDTKSYITFMTIEIKRDEIINQAASKLKEYDKTMQDTDIDRLKQIYEEEIESETI